MKSLSRNFVSAKGFVPEERFVWQEIKKLPESPSPGPYRDRYVFESDAKTSGKPPMSPEKLFFQKDPDWKSFDEMEKAVTKTEEEEKVAAINSGLQKLSDTTDRLLKLLEERDKRYEIERTVSTLQNRGIVVDENFTNSLRELQALGCHIEWTFSYVFRRSNKEKTQPDFMKAFINLQKNGIDVTGEVLEAINKEKTGKDFMGTFLELKKLGIVIDGNVIKALTREKMGKDFMDTFRELKNNGIKVDGGVIKDINREKMGKDFMNAFFELKNNGIKVDGDVIYALNKEKIGKDFMDAFLELKKNGIEVDGKVIDALNRKKIERNFMDAFLELKNGGIKVTGYVIEFLTKEKIQPDFMKAFIDLQKNGVLVRGFTIAALDKKKIGEDFMNAFILLQKNGIGVTHGVIDSLNKEKIGEDFIKAFILLQKSKIDVTYEVIGALNKEKIQPDFIKAFIDLQKSGKSVYVGDVELITKEKIHDRKYWGVLMQNKGDYSEAGRAYLSSVFQQEIEEDSGPQKLLECKVSPLATLVAKQILSEWLRPSCLKFVQKMNDLHEQSNEKRLEVVNGFSAEFLYEIIVQGNEEVFTSTFKLLFDRALMPKLKSSPEYRGNGNKLLQKLDYDGMRTFLRTCAQYDRLNVFLGTMSSAEQTSLLEKFIGNLDQASNPLAESVSIGEALTYTRKQPQISKVLESKLKSEYERATKSNPKIAKLYGIIAATHAGVAISDQEWFHEMKEKYPLPDLNKIESKELFNNGINVQQHFFYNDADGASSFGNFRATYQNAGWEWRDKGKYVMVQKSLNGKTVQIYANKPANEEDGPEEIDKVFEKMHLQSIVVVHRGHSYHAQDTIDRIPRIARIINMGGCGGFGDMSSILEKAPNAHVISTKGTGNTWVNDPLFKRLNDLILSGKDVGWADFWKKESAVFERIGGETLNDFNEYVPPHKNIAIQIIRAYNGE